MTQHPIRDAAIHTFERRDDGTSGPRWLARFWPYSVYPVIFQGASEHDVASQAESMRAEAIEKHEAAYINRQKALEKARATRAAKSKESQA